MDLTPYRTTTVTALCRQMRADRDYGLVPILADALEDAGYTDEEVLRQLRDPALPEVEACRLAALFFSPESAAAVAFLERFGAANDIGTYDHVMHAARSYAEHGEYLCDGDRWEGCYAEDDFWDAYELVAGRVEGWANERYGYTRGNFFSCSC